MKTTLNELEKHNFHFSGGCKLMRYLGKTEIDDEPLDLLTILESNGLDDTLWCLRAVEGFDREKRLLAVAFAREVEHLMPEASKPALDVAERFANGLATEEELAQTCDAAWAAALDAADAAWAAAYAAAYAAWAAYDAACAACAAYAAYAATYKAARSEMQAKQTQILRKFLEGTV